MGVMFALPFSNMWRHDFKTIAKKRIWKTHKICSLSILYEYEAVVGSWSRFKSNNVSYTTTETGRHHLRLLFIFRVLKVSSQSVRL